MVFASRHPEKVVAAVIEAMGPSSSEARSAGRMRAEQMLKSMPKEFASWTEAEAFLRSRASPLASQEVINSRLENTLNQSSDGTITWRYDIQGIARALADTSRWVDDVDLWPHVQALQCPTLVIRGARSDGLSRETATEMTNANSNIQWVEIPEATHQVHGDNTPAFNREAGRFLESIR